MGSLTFLAAAGGLGFTTSGSGLCGWRAWFLTIREQSFFVKPSSRQDYRFRLLPGLTHSPTNTRHDALMDIAGCPCRIASTSVVTVRFCLQSFSELNNKNTKAVLSRHVTEPKS